MKIYLMANKELIRKGEKRSAPFFSPHFASGRSATSYSRRALSEIIKSFFIRFADNYLGLFFIFLPENSLDKMGGGSDKVSADL